MDIRISTQRFTTIDGPTTAVHCQARNGRLVARYTKVLPMEATSGHLSDAILALTADAVLWSVGTGKAHR